MNKNTAGQKLTVFAFDRTTGAAKTGDAANITCKESIDNGAYSALTDTNPDEKESGFYEFDLTQAESNGNKLAWIPVSTTENVMVIACPAVVYTSPPSFQSLVVNNLDASITSRSTFDPDVDIVARVTLVDSCTENEDMRGTDGAVTDISALALEETSQDIKAKTDNLPESPADVSDIPSIPTDYAKESTSQAIKERTDRLPDMPSSSGDIPSAEQIQGYTGSEPADVSDRTSYGMLRLLFGRFFNRNEATATEHVTYDEAGETVKVRRPISETETTQTIGKAT